MRRAYFADARGYSALVMQHASAGDEPTAADMTMMADLEAELDAFLADVESGRA